ncbi:KR domain-containing protein [Nocardiopsis changdeensis]|uniref:KR domain-containing protein n=1 Tax=Nocardiopsis TaxID=2013 RepID=UPI001C7381B1|nr:KR domain-containing protein [Nocardiopsis sp. MT53]QYX35224.1 KR domain-containing protein [Nocardiopsis sp. MT53]
MPISPAGPVLHGGGPHGADLVFREDDAVGRGPRNAPARTVVDAGPGRVRVRAGSRWYPGDGDRLLEALARAERCRIPVELVGGGLSLGGVLAAAAAERPRLRVRVRTAGGRTHGPVDATSWRPVSAPRRVRARGAVLIAGGLGGIGLSLARELGAAGHRLVLVDRIREEDLPPGRAAALALVRASAPVRVVCADLDRVDPGPLLRSLSDPAVHLVHAAGELVLERWSRLSGAALDRAARRRGEHLRRWVRAAAAGPLSSVLLMGSSESRSAHRGFGAYALSHACARAAVRDLAAALPGVGFTVAEWTLWSGVGMAAGVAGPGLRAAGFAAVPPAWGAHTAARLLGGAPGRGTAEVYALGGPRPPATPGSVAVVGGVGGTAVLDGADPGAALGRMVRGCLPGAGGRGAGPPPAPARTRTVRALVGPAGVRLWSSSPADWRPDGAYEALVPF